MQTIISPNPNIGKYPKRASRKTHYATIGSKYQIVIPKEVRRELNIKPGQKLYIDATPDGKVYMIVPPANWSDQNFGALRKYWKGINMIKEVEKIRNESNP